METVGCTDIRRQTALQDNCRISRKEVIGNDFPDGINGFFLLPEVCIVGTFMHGSALNYSRQQLQNNAMRYATQYSRVWVLAILISSSCSVVPTYEITDSVEEPLN